jgi:hypothetical protein
MPRVTNRLSPTDSLLSVNPDTGVAIPISGRHTFLSSCASFIDGSASIFLNDLPAASVAFTAGDRVSIYATSGIFPSITALTGERIVEKATRVGSLTIVEVEPDEYQTSIPASAQYTASIAGEVTQVYSHKWIADNAAVSTVATNFDTLSRYVLKISPSSTGAIKLTLSNVLLLSSDSTRPFQFNAKISPNATITATAKLAMAGDLSLTTGVSQTLYGGRYGAIRSNVLTMPDLDDPTNEYYGDDYLYVDIEIEIINHKAQTLYMTLPHLVDDDIHNENWFLANADRLMPDFYKDFDEAQENPSQPFRKFIDALMVISGQVREEYRNQYAFEKEEIPALETQVNQELRSNLVDPLYAKNEYLPWLAQFTGTKLKRNIILADGSKLLPNTDTENEYARWQLNTGFYGLNAGTRQAIIEAARQALIFTKDGTQPTKAVALTARYGGDVFTIRIQTLLNETPDVTVSGNTSIGILDAVEPTRPLGYKVIHTTSASFAFTLGDSTLGVLGDLGVG